MNKNKDVIFSLTKENAKTVAAGLMKALPGDRVIVEALDSTLYINIKNSKNTKSNLRYIICLLKSFIPFIYSGHEYVEIEKYKNKTITLSRCQRCDKTDITWE